MKHGHLADAAIALSRILTFHRIHHGFFGGFAILSTTSSPARETKDLDVLVSASKETVSSLLSARYGWLEIPCLREDYLAYFYRRPTSAVSSSAASYSSSMFSDHSDSEEDPSPTVLVELFVGHQAARFPVSKNCVLRGAQLGVSYVPLLSEEYLFRGKLNAAATRGKEGDAIDLMYLVKAHGAMLRERLDGIDKKVVNEAVRRHPELRKALAEVGIKAERPHRRWRIGRRKQVVAAQTVPAGVWDVQRGLGWE